MIYKIYKLNILKKNNLKKNKNQINNKYNFNF